MIAAALLCCIAMATELLPSPRLAQIESQLALPRDPRPLESFWRETRRTGTPLIESVPGDPDLMQVTFLWRGPASATPPRVFGIFNARPWTDGDPMRHLPGSDIWYRSYRLPVTLRAPYNLLGPRAQFPALSFQRVWEGERSHDLLLDPLNPHRVPDVYSRRLSFENLFEGPRAPALAWLNGTKLRGQVASFSLRISPSDAPRRIIVYRPPVVRAAAPPGILVAFDGLSYRTPGMVPELLDHLIADGRIPPTAAVLIDSGPLDRRAKELNANPVFERFVVERVLPLVRTRFGLTDDPRRTIAAGASRGGLAAASIALHYPGTFGNVIAQSAAFWSAPEQRDHSSDWIARQYLAAPAKLPIRFHVAPGTMEDPEDMLGPNRRFRDLLRGRGYRICYREFVGGHTFVNWRDDLAVAMIEMTRPWDQSDPCEATDVSTGNATAAAAKDSKR